MTEPARNFQHYEVLRHADGSPWELGRGAMGVTYKAFDVNLCCEVALKVVNSALLDRPDAKERFVREARAAAALRHRNVASVYHLGNDGEHFFYAMEFIDGETLDALVRRQGPLPVQAVLRVILQVSKALAAADRQHLVHRDIKPANLMIVHEDADEDMTVKVIDFGLARPTADVDGAAPVTLAGFVGTPQYASPEQLEERPLDVRSDIYSLGVTAWYLLAARPPFTGSLATVCQQQLGKAPPWDNLPSGLPVGLRRLLGRMLEKEPGNRPQNARELRAEVEACLHDLDPIDGEHLVTKSLFAKRDSTQDIKERAVTAAESGDGSLTTLADGRYTLLHLLDEGLGTLVYRARDEEREGIMVTVRTLSLQLTDDKSGQSKVREEVRLIQAAAHPNLVQIYSLEPAAAAAPAFLVEETLAGFSLRDLLAARGGDLSLSETLPILEQTAEALDHSARCRLEHLDLSLRHIHIHFPFADAEADGEETTRTLLLLPIEKWPLWKVKIHPFATERGGDELYTWAGDVTLMPGAGASAPRSAVNAVATELWHLNALAGITYELLGGTLISKNGQFPGSKITALPTLNEAGNAVLLKALSGSVPYPDCHAFYASLSTAATDARTVGNEPAQKESEFLPAAKNDLQRMTVGLSLAVGQSDGASGSPSPVSVSRTSSLEKQRLAGAGTTHLPAESVADLFERSSYSGETPAEGSAWERLVMARGEPARPGRWIFGVMAAGLVFICVFIGVLAVLLHGEPMKKARVVIDTNLPSGRAAPRRAPTPGSSPDVPNNAAGFRADTSVRPKVADVPTEDNPSPLQSLAIQPVLKSSNNGAPDLIVPSPASPNPAPPMPEKLIAVRMFSGKRGAEVHWHGKLLGITPTVVYLPPGEQEFIVRYPNGPETHQTVVLDAEQVRAAVEIRPMTADLVPLSVTASPGNHSPLVQHAGVGAPTRVERAVPVAPPPGLDAVPARRPVPLEPFIRDLREKDRQPTESATPKNADDVD